MNTLVLAAAFIALAAVTAVAVRAYLFVKRVHQLVDRDVSAVIQDLGETVQGARRAVGKLDDNLDSLASTLARIDRVTAALEPDSLARVVAQPALRKLATWLGGLRRGLAAARSQSASGSGGAGEDDSEAG